MKWSGAAHSRCASVARSGQGLIMFEIQGRKPTSGDHGGGWAGTQRSEILGLQKFMALRLLTVVRFSATII